MNPITESEMRESTCTCTDVLFIGLDRILEEAHSLFARQRYAEANGVYRRASLYAQTFGGSA